MSETRTIQTTFTGGEVSPNVNGRIDNKRYQSGAAKLENMIVTDQGGIVKRNGTKAIYSFLDNDASNGFRLSDEVDKYGRAVGGKKGVRSIPFIITKEESYSLVLMAKNSSGNFLGTEILIYDNRNHKLLFYQTNDHQQSSVVTRIQAAGASSNPNGYNVPVRVYRESSNLSNTAKAYFPWTEDELNEIDYAQNDNEIYLVHRNHKPFKITRKRINNTKAGVDDHRQWDGEEVKFYDGPFLTTKQGKKLSVAADDPDQDVILTINVDVDDTHLSASNPLDLTHIGGINHADNASNLTNGIWVEYDRGDAKLLGEITDVSDIANGNLIVTSKDNVLEITEEGANFESDNIIPNICRNLYSQSSVWSKNHEDYYFKHRQMMNIWEVYRWSAWSGTSNGDPKYRQPAGGWGAVEKFISSHVWKLVSPISTTNDNEVIKLWKSGSGASVSLPATYGGATFDGTAPSQDNHFGLPFRGIVAVFYSTGINQNANEISHYLNNTSSPYMELISYNGVSIETASNGDEYYKLHNTIRGQHSSTKITQNSGTNGFVYPLLPMEDIYTVTETYKHPMKALRWKEVSNWYKITEHSGTKVIKSFDIGGAANGEQGQTSPSLRTWGATSTLSTGNNTLNESLTNAGTNFVKNLHDAVGGKQTGLECYNNDIGYGTQARAGITADIVKVDPVITDSGVDAQIDFSDNSISPVARELTPGHSLYQTKRVILARLSSSVPVFVPERDWGRQIRLDFNGEKVWGRLVRPDQSEDEFHSYHTNGRINGAWGSDGKKAVVALDVPPPIFLSKDRSNVTHNWQFGAWHGAAGVDGANYPQSVAFFENRLVFGGSRYNPQSLWFSKLNEYETFSITDEDGNVLDSSSIQYTIASDDVSSIQWLSPSDNLLVGTTIAEWRVSSSDLTVTLSPTNITINQQTQYGSDYVKPVRVGGSTIFVQAPGKVIRELAYNYETNAYRAIDLTSVAEHLFTPNDPVVETAALRYPHNFVFFRTLRGRLICLTYEKENDVVAASRVTIGGFQPFDITNGTAATGWATNQPYDLNTVVYYEGLTYQGAKPHTSSDFWTDYAEGNWIHCGASVISISALPSTRPSEADRLLLTTYRRPYRHTASSLATNHGVICLETLSPLGDAVTEMVDSKPKPMGIVPLDFHYGYDSTAAPHLENSLTNFNFNPDIDEPFFYLPNPTFASSNDSPWHNILSQLTAVMNNYMSGVGIGLYRYNNKVSKTSFTTNKLFTPELDQFYQSHSNQKIVKSNNHYNIRPQDTSTNYSFQGLSGGHIYNWRAGFEFPSMVKTLPMEMVFEKGGTSMGRIRRINEVSLLLRSSGKFLIGGKTLDEVLDDELQYDGLKTVSLDFDYEERQDFAIISIGPQNFHLLAYSPEVTINQ